MKPDERAFEEHIAGSPVESGGYRAVKVGNASGDFDAGRRLDLAELFAFVEATQAGEPFYPCNATRFALHFGYEDDAILRGRGSREAALSRA